MSDDYNEDVGYHFDPTDKGLIKDYLIRKIDGKACGDFIVMKDVYAKEPWLLDHTNDPIFMKDEWYYFVKRTQKSNKKIGCGKYAKGRITGDNNDGIDHGYWNANGKENIIDKDTENIIGIKQNLTYIKSNNDKKKQKRGDGASAIVSDSESSWIMNEFRLPDKYKFQELVLCKIHKKKDKNYENHNHKASTYTCTHNHHHES